MLAKSRSRKSSVVASKLTGQLPRSTVERPGSDPTASVVPQGSRFTVLANEIPSSKPATAAAPVGQPDPTPQSAASQLGSPKKQKAKKGVGLTPEAETSSMKMTGKRAPKSTTPKGAASVSIKGKNNAQITILKRQRPAADKTPPKPPSSTVPEASSAKTQAPKDDVRIMGVTSQPRQAQATALAAVDMIVDPSTDGSMPSVFREVLVDFNDKYYCLEL
ncbi:hypothetical protein LINPERHAP1_LOCUS17869 [Linum perenne]